MDNDTVNFTSLCEEAKAMSGIWQLKVILILQCIVGPLAIFPNLLAMILLYRVKVFHLNLRVLLIHLNFTLTCYSITLSAKAFRRLLTPACQLPTPTLTCIMQEWHVLAPLHNAVLSLLILLIERVYCTLRFRTYDKAGKRPYLAIFLLMCSWLGTFGIETSTYFNPVPKLWMSTCELAVAVKNSLNLIIVPIFLICEISSIIIMICVYFYNRYLLGHMAINRAQFDLSSRFQVDQNVKLNAALMPSDLLHILSYFPSYSSLLTTFIPSLQMAPENKLWFLHLTYLWRMIYAFVHPTILITLNPNVRQSLQKTKLGHLLCGWRSTRISNAVAENTIHKQADVHFEHLSKMWADGGKKNVNKKQSF